MSSSSIRDFNPHQDGSLDGSLDDMDEVVRIVTNASQQADGGVLTKLSTLSKKLSKRTKEHAKPYDFEDEEDFDFRRILKLFIKSADAQGIHLRSTGVVFKGVRVKGVDSASSFVPTVLDFLHAPKAIANAITGKNKQQVKDIVKNVYGVVKPGEMCLVLGRPGAGCSTLLKTLAGEQDNFISVEGDINYDNISQSEMLEKYRGDILYNGELDVHYPHLTVDQTLKFSIGCKTPKTRVNNATREQYIEANRDLLATIFGLRHTYNTKVGNDFVRGVSGGERKRVSIAEAMSCKASVYCWDNATRGLDASTALEYAQAIRTQTSLTKSVSFITIYQAGENIYETFDKVLVLYEGRQVFFGRTEVAKDYFVQMGFECSPRQATAEFLTAVTDPIGRTARPGFENSVPRTPDEFEQRWLESSYFAQLQMHIDEYQEKEANADATRDLYDKSLQQEKKRKHYRYTVKFTTQLNLLVRRGFQRIYGDTAFTVTQTAAAAIQALIVGSLYWATPSDTSGAFSRGGMIYFYVLYFSLMGLAEVPAQFKERPILLKQKSYSLFHPSAEVLASFVTKFPFKLLSIVVFFIISYFLSNLTRDAWRFFLSLLFLIISSESIGALFQMVAALSKDVAGANAVAGLFMLTLSTYSGFMIQTKSMHPWFKWIIYINPITYGFENIMNTEFHGREMDCGDTLVPSGAGFENPGSGEQVCAFAGAQTGQSFVNGDAYLKTQFNFKFSYNWRNFGIIIAFIVFFIAVNCVVTEYKKPANDGGDHLFFKRSKSTQKMVAAAPAKGSDVESGEHNVHDSKIEDTSSAEQNNDIFRGLGSKKVFAWQNVDYVIPYKGGSRKLLDNIQGYVKPGTLTALMGESGAGKTTLLNVLSQRVDMGTITGDFLVNGAKLDTSFRRSTGYVQQQDLHVAELTVRESLQFAARLRRAKSVPDSEKLDYVEKIIAILSMESYAEAIIGESGAGLNVEQRKKLSIGVELVAKPSLLLFLDEPTSGLDSQSAWAIVNLLQKLAAAGQSILCTIHQPSATLFEAFDRLLLLKKGGQTVYFGDIGKNSKIILDYFERNGARPCTPSENPAEYILESIGAGATASIKEDWFEIWKKSEEYRDTTQEVEKIKYIQNNEEDGLTDAERKALHDTYAMPYFDQLRYVTRRTRTQLFRSPQYIISKFMLYLSGGLFIGFTFWNIEPTIIGMQNGMFAVFLSIIISVPAINQIQERAVASRELFEVRESKSNTFHWSTLLIAQFVNEIPYHLLVGAIYFVCLYFPMKINNAASRSAVWYLNYAIMYQLYTISFGLMIVYFSPDLASAAVITGLFVSFMISFCGVVQPLSLMPQFWTFMYKVSPLTYIIQTLMALVLHNKAVVCGEDEYSFFNPPQGMTCSEYAQPFIDETQRGYLKNPEATSNCGYCQYSVADEYMATVNVKYSYRWRNFGFMWVYIMFNLAAMCGLYYFFRIGNINLFAPIQNLIERFQGKKEAKKEETPAI